MTYRLTILFFIILFSIFSVTEVFADNAKANIDAGTLNYWRADGGFVKNLSLGSRGSAVSYMQAYLHNLYPTVVGKVDGSYGKRTLQALITFQKDNNLLTTGYFDSTTRALFNSLFLEELCPHPKINSSDMLLMPISKTLGLDSSYAPSDLVVLPSTVHANGIICLRQSAADAYVVMVTSAKTQGLTLGVTSGFRNYAIQSYLQDVYKDTLGITQAARVSAPPGHSEHQLGTAMDLTGASINFASTSSALGLAPEGMWLRAHAYEFGFVQSYASGTEAITGYADEPWHYRYVGKEMAKIIHDASPKTPFEVLKDSWQK